MAELQRLQSFRDFELNHNRSTIGQERSRQKGQDRKIQGTNSEEEFHCTKMKLVVFGGTGPSGMEVVKQALKCGHTVTVIARTPGNMELKHANLKVVKGDACDLNSFVSVLSDKDAVLSCLGAKTTGPFASTTLYSDTIKNIIEAMKRNYITRLIVITSWCTRPGPNNPWFIEWFLKPFIIGGCLRDMAVMEKLLEDANPDEINYTIVKPPGLSLAEGNGNYKIEEGQCNVGTTMRIPRADVAHFMLAALETDKYNHKTVAIGSLEM